MKISPWHINSLKWVIPILILKGLLFTYFAWELHQLEGDKLTAGVFRIYDDTRSYYDPIENWVDGNGYSRFGYEAFDESEIVPFAGRLPGILPIYGAVYAVMGHEAGSAAMIFLQFLMGCFGVWLLGQVAFRLLKSQVMAFIVMGLYLIYYPLHIYEHAGASESLSMVSCLLSFWFLLKYEEKGLKKYVLWAGIFFAWAVFCRPIFGAFGVGFMALLFMKKNKSGKLSLQSPSLSLSHSLLLLLPLLLALSAWTIRNKVTLNRFIPLEDAWHLSYPHEPEYGEGGMAIRKLIRTWGGDMLYWTEGSMGNVLMNPNSALTVQKDLPQRIYTSDYQADSIQLLISYYNQGNQQKAASMANRFLGSYQQNKPLEAYFLSRIRLTANFFFRLIRHDLPYPSKDKIKPYQFVIKAFYILYYYLWAILGMLGGIFILWKKEKRLSLWLLFPISMTLILTMVLGMIEERYLLPLFPFMLIYGVNLLSHIPFMRKVIPFSAKS